MRRSTGVDLFYGRYCTIPEFIFAVEDYDFCNPVQSCLDLNSCSSAAGTYDGHFFANDVNVVVLQSLHKSDTVCDMTGQMAVVIDDGIDSTAKLSCR